MVRKFTKSEGDFLSAIDCIHRNGRTVASFEDIMRERLEGRFLHENFVTSDAVVYLPNGDLMIDYNSRFTVGARTSTIEPNFNSASFEVPLNRLGLVNGPTITHDQILNLNRDNPKMNPILLALAGYSHITLPGQNEQPLLDSYVDRVPHKQEGRAVMFPLLNHHYMDISKLVRSDGLVKISPVIMSSVYCNSSPNLYCDALCNGQTLLGKKVA